MGDPENPRLTLKDIEKKIDSQNGEDGVIAYLVDCLHDCGKRFLNIGCGTGKRDNTMQLARQNWFGIAIDRKHKRVNDYKEKCQAEGIEYIQFIAEQIEPSTVDRYVDLMPRPDVFSIDIDSWDWHVVKRMLELGFKPKIAVCEYNSAFEDHPVTIPYNPRFKQTRNTKNIYFGASVMAWRSLLGNAGYEFVTVESAGVNCFFVDPSAIDMDRVNDVEWLAWADSIGLTAATGMNASHRWKRIRDMPLEYV